jgi:p-aminobenzoyl-glutamate transporter AbgT
MNRQEVCFIKVIGIAMVVAVVVCAIFFVVVWSYQSTLSEEQIKAAVASAPIEQCSMYCPRQAVVAVILFFGGPVALYGLWRVCGEGVFSE